MSGIADILAHAARRRLSILQSASDLTGADEDVDLHSVYLAGIAWRAARTTENYRVAGDFYRVCEDAADAVGAMREEIR